MVKSNCTRVTRWSSSVIRATVGVTYVNICVSTRLKEELIWAIDKRIRLIKTSNSESQGQEEAACVRHQAYVTTTVLELFTRMTALIILYVVAQPLLQLSFSL